MTTESIEKKIIVQDKKTFERLIRDIESKADHNRKVESAPSLEKGSKKLKQFTFL